MICFFELPNEILSIILAELDPFVDFQQLVSFPQFKPLIDSSLCVLSDDLRVKKTTSLPVIHLASYEDIIDTFEFFIITICAPVGEAFLPKIVNSMILHRKPHTINFHSKLLPRGFFNHSIFNGNEYTRGVLIENAVTLGSASTFEKIYDTMNFVIDAPKLEVLYADFGNRKSFLRNFKLPNLTTLEVKSSHLSSNCIKMFKNLVKLGINSFSDLEDLRLDHLREIKLSAGYSLMLSNCKFKSLKILDIHPDARLPGIINCELDSLKELDIKATRTSYIKDIYAPNLIRLNLVHTMKGVLNTLVFEGGQFPSLRNVRLPSPVYLCEFEQSNNHSSIESVTIFIQKQWFYPTVPMYLMKDDDIEAQELSMADELEIITRTKMGDLTELKIIVENPTKPQNSILKVPDLLKSTSVDNLVFQVSLDDLDEYTEFDLRFLQKQPLHNFYTNIEKSSLIGFDSYRISRYHYLRSVDYDELSYD